MQVAPCSHRFHKYLKIICSLSHIIIKVNTEHKLEKSCFRFRPDFNRIINFLFENPVLRLHEFLQQFQVSVPFLHK